MLVEGIAAQDRRGQGQTLPCGSHRHHAAKTQRRVGGSQPGPEEGRREDTRLAEFPGENPNPVLRAAERTEAILYANNSAGRLLETMGWQKGDAAPAVFREIAETTLRANAAREVDVPWRETPCLILLLRAAGR